MTFSLLDLVGTDTALALLHQPGRPFYLGADPLRWECVECGNEIGCIRTIDGARVWCDTCRTFDTGETT